LRSRVRYSARVESVVSIRGVEKRYGALTALAGVDLDRHAYCARKRIEHETPNLLGQVSAAQRQRSGAPQQDGVGVYFPSLSARTFIYKGMLTTLELPDFYLDLVDDVDADQLSQFDGVVLSNGPGDPGPLEDETVAVRDLLGRVPVFGICLGHQLLGLATGHETFKLPFGHRGANHPVLERADGRVLVTSQNHGFAVRPSDDAEATAVSLYDGTVEGFAFPDLRARSVQFHPEAGPGPHDGWPLLEIWVEELAQTS